MHRAPLDATPAIAANHDTLVQGVPAQAHDTLPLGWVMTDHTAEPDWDEATWDPFKFDRPYPMSFSSSRARDEEIKLNKYHLLSLPKDLRLQIWRYVLTDPSAPDLTVAILRQPASRRYKFGRPPGPKLVTSLTPNRKSRINTRLLQTSRLIYEEALPVLYNSVQFAPLDLQGLFPFFLERLSPFAKSCIRNIKLNIPDPSVDDERDRGLVFHWAVTCAQVAKMRTTLRSIEIGGDFSVIQDRRNRKSILYPLCRIKGTKRFKPAAFDSKFQQLLSCAEQEVEANAKAREERKKANAADAAVREENMRRILREKLLGLPPESKIERTPVTLRHSRRLASAVENDDPMVLEQDRRLNIHHLGFGLEEDTNSNSGHKNTGNRESDMVEEGWDLVSIRSGTSSQKSQPASVRSRKSDDSWINVPG